ncbi:hypothetical protein CPB84DRAFT_1230485 [Gymnopilus junonius]|uniref:Uncharacterized protein n=1 Tax=Gymnopilus junonius TaxID=109634 RepID=A0A9P5NVI3_GYMJU|nr:hypothetical protein CPB84DRAFT_1230485 [Gymnopilus junonius]
MSIKRPFHIPLRFLSKAKVATVLQHPSVSFVNNLFVIEVSEKLIKFTNQALTVMSTLKLGIAFYAQQDRRGRPRSPHWALVAHRTNYAAPDVQVFQARFRADTQWVLAHRTVPLLSNASSLMGVIHIADVNISPGVLDSFVRSFPASKNDDDPSGNIVWDCSNWVIRVLHYLTNQNVLSLPWRINDFYQNI